MRKQPMRRLIGAYFFSLLFAISLGYRYGVRRMVELLDERTRFKPQPPPAFVPREIVRPGPVCGAGDIEKQLEWGSR